MTHTSVPDSKVYEYLSIVTSVKNWISTVLQVPLKDLSELQNGIVLCYLMQALSPRLMPRIQENTTADIKLKENILFFLAAIEEYGVPKYRLFKVNDLWDGSNMVNVVLSIQALAKESENEWKDFGVRMVEEEVVKVEMEAEEMKRIKEQLAKVREGAPERKWKKAASIIRRELSLRVGNDVDIESYEGVYAKLQGVIRGNMERKMYIKRVRNQAYRDNVMAEIISTEKTYVESLQACLDHYQDPLLEISRGKKPFITTEQVKTLFSDLKLILDVNLDLYNELLVRWENWSPYQKIGDVFLERIHFLKIYSNYVQNYNAAQKMYSEIVDNKDFQKFVVEARERIGSPMDIPGFIIMPIQRVPRYNMLLSDYAKHTWEDHQEYADLTAATQEIEKLALYLNEKKRSAENLDTMVSISNCLTGFDEPLLIPSRHLIEEFDMTVKRKPRKILLFNDIVILAESTEKKGVISYKFKEKYLIKDTICTKDDDETVTISNEIGSETLKAEPHHITKFHSAYRTALDAINISATNRKIALGIEDQEEALSVAERLHQRKNASQDIKKSLTKKETDLDRGYSLIELKVIYEGQLKDIPDDERESLEQELVSVTAQLQTLKAKLTKQELTLLSEAEAHAQDNEYELIRLTSNKKPKKEKETKTKEKEAKNKKKNRKSFLSKAKEKRSKSTEKKKRKSIDKKKKEKPIEE